MSDELEHELWAADLQDAEDQIAEAFGDTRAPQPVDVDLLTARLTANADHLRRCFDIPRLKPAIDDMCLEALLENISQAIAALQQQTR